jgi:hypothetical protein
MDTVVDDSAPTTQILLASAACNKADGFKCTVEALARSLDLDVQFVSLQGSADVPDFFGITVSPKIGENLHFKTSEGKVILPILGQFSPRPEWRKELEEIKKQTAIDGTAAKDFVLVGKPCTQHSSDASPPPGPTKDTHLCLWLPADFSSVLERVRNHISLGEGECMSIQLRLQNHDQIAASLTLAMFEQELHFIKKKIRRWSLKFTSALALTMVVTEDLRWMCAAGSVNAVSAIMNKLSHYWRVTLLQKSDTELGIGVPGEERDGTTSLSHSRAALQMVLRHAASRLDYLPFPIRRHVSLKWMAYPRPTKRKFPMRESALDGTAKDAEAERPYKQQNIDP